MKGLAVVFLAVVGIASAHGVYEPSIYGMQALKIFPDTAIKREFVRKHEDLPGFDFLKMARSSDVPIELLIAPDQLEMFKIGLERMQISYEVFAEDVSKVIQEELA